jgi:SAM-dependent methyltransferase/uncharacterized protein YbaR (Trm112 family)
MLKDLNIFVDPKTKRRLDLKIFEEKEGRVISGKLYNKECAYPIVSGIPRFVDMSFYKKMSCKTGEIQTSASFGDKWRSKRSQQLGYAKRDIPFLREQFIALLGCGTEAQLRKILAGAERTLNAGCGVAWSEHLFNDSQRTERHCIDISLAVETAHKNTQSSKNIIVSQASIFELPYADETFDVIYSLGVLHHTPNPKKAFFSLVEKLKPRGLIGIYIYCKKPLLREMADGVLRARTTKMSFDECMKFSKKMTQLGKSLQSIKEPIVIAKEIEALGIQSGSYSVHDFIYRYFLKCWFNPDSDEAYADLVNQDWYHPAFASHHTREEILSWFLQAELQNVRCIQPKGWGHSGFFVSGRKRQR